MQFKVVTTQLPSSFAVQPAAGVLPPGKTVVLAAQFCPQDQLHATGSIVVLLNGSAQASPTVTFEGRGYTTRVTVDPSAGLLCKPTCAGASSGRDVTLQNHSRLPATFAWVIPPEWEQTFRMAPATGVLPGCGSETVRCTFTPCGEGSHRAMASCLLRGGASLEECAAFSAEAEQQCGRRAWQHDDRVQLQLSGVTAEALLKVEPRDVNFGTVVAGKESGVSFELRNCSGGSVRYRLSAQMDGVTVPFRSAVRGNKATGNDAGIEIDVSPTCGTIAARAAVTVDLALTVRSSRTAAVKITCHYGALAATSEPEDAAACQQQVCLWAALVAHTSGATKTEACQGCTRLWAYVCGLDPHRRPTQADGWFDGCQPACRSNAPSMLNQHSPPWRY